MDNYKSLAESGLKNRVNPSEFATQELKSERPSRSSETDYYGEKTPINQISSIQFRTTATIIKLYDKKRRIKSPTQRLMHRLWGTTYNDGDITRLILPPLTEDSRKELVRQ